MLLRDLHACGERLLTALTASDPELLGHSLTERADLLARIEAAGAFEDQPEFSRWGARVIEQHRAIDQALVRSLLEVERRMADLDRAEAAQKRYAPAPSGGVLRHGLAA
jgi:hypothetical protein